MRELPPSGYVVKWDCDLMSVLDENEKMITALAKIAILFFKTT